MTMKEPFENAVQQHGATVLRVCRAVLGPGADAEDAWSETFLAALRSWPDLAENTNLQAWLVRVAQRKAVDITRTRARHAIPTEDLPEQESRLGIPGTDDRSVWPSPRYRSGNDWPLPTTTSVDYRTPRPPSSSAAAPRQYAARPPTDSRT